MEYNRLLYRRQFILADCPVANQPGWTRFDFASLSLTVHPDLEITQATGKHGHFLLLGFLLNHRWPSAGNQQLLDNLANASDTLEQLFEQCRDLCGRYVIVFSLDGTLGALSDLIGSRTIYYYHTNNSLWCASQPSTLAKHLGLQKDSSSIVREYADRDMFTNGEGHWIGDGTPYPGIRHLLPNHYLDLRRSAPVRYWPKHHTATLPCDIAAEEAATILRNTLTAASNRFNLSLAITGGWDSRCLLAASRDVKSKVFYFVQKYGQMTDRHPDILIPRTLSDKCAIAFHVFDCPASPADSFNEVLEQNVFCVHSQAKIALYKCFASELQDKVNVAGCISEVCRNYYGRDPIHNIKDLLARTGNWKTKYARTAINHWYSVAKQVCDSTGYSVLDLFYWEQRLGNWGSMFAAELDIAIDEFYPFGTRRLVEILLAVDPSEREYSHSRVHRRIIEHLWPELLSEPINPSTFRDRLIKSIRQRCRRALASMGALDLVNALRYRGG